MKKILLLVFVFVCISGYSQDTRISSFLKYQKECIVYDSLYSVNEVYCVKSIDSDEIGVAVFQSVDTGLIGNIRFYDSDLSLLDSIDLYLQREQWLYDFTFTSKYIAYVADDYSYVISRDAGEVCFCVSSKDCKSYRNKFIGNSELLYYFNYRQYPANGANTVMSKYDIKKQRLDAQIAPEFKNIEFTHLSPFDWFDCNYGKVLFVNAVDYYVRIYDKNLNLINTIKAPDDYKWNPPTPQQKNELVGTRAAVCCGMLSKYLLKTDIIEDVYWISDSCFVVKVNHGVDGKESVTYIDVWEKKNEEWKLKYSKLFDERIENLKLNEGECSLFEDDFTVFNYLFTDEFLYLVCVKAPIKLNEYSSKEFISKSNEYLYKNDPKFHLIKIKHSFNE